MGESPSRAREHRSESRMLCLVYSILFRESQALDLNPHTQLIGQYVDRSKKLAAKTQARVRAKPSDGTVPNPLRLAGPAGHVDNPEEPLHTIFCIAKEMLAWASIGSAGLERYPRYSASGWVGRRQWATNFYS